MFSLIKGQDNPAFYINKILKVGKFTLRYTYYGYVGFGIRVLEKPSTTLLVQIYKLSLLFRIEE